MILTDREIRLALQEGHIEVKPTPDLSVSITSTAMDLTLGNVFKTWPKVNGMSIRPRDKDYKYSDYAKFQELWTESRFFPLKPKGFVLACLQKPFSCRKNQKLRQELREKAL